MEPVGASAEARRFIEQSGTADWQAVDLSVEGLVILRQENSEVAAPGCDKVRAEVGAHTEDAEIGGVGVQWVVPRQVRGAEVVLYLFGGGFLVGSPEDDLSISARLADHLGRRVCAPRYRLAPEHPFPAARDDVTAVYRGLVSDVSFGGVVVVGESAGGNLALGLVQSAKAAGLPLPASVGLLSPWIDLTHSGDSHVTLAGKDPTLSVEHFLEPAAMAYAGGMPRTSPDISPLFAEAPADFPPTVISTATRDLLLSDCVRLVQKLRAQGTTVELEVADGLWHVFEWYPDLPEAAISLQRIATFLGKYLAPSAMHNV